MLAMALAVMVALSCFEPVKIGGHEFKSVTFIDEITRHDNPWDVDTLSADTVATDTVALSPFPVPVDTATKTILFFGDSMLEGLSPRLAAYCKANGHSLYTVIWYSSTTQTWGDCDTLSVFIRRHKPDYVVACLGANELFVKDIATKRTKPFENIMKQVGGRPLLWIGPPNWKEDTGINDFLESSLPQGAFFLTNGMKFDRKSDGAHPTKASAAEWMDSVVRWMPEHSCHPIRLDSIPPLGVSGRPKRVTLLQPLK